MSGKGRGRGWLKLDKQPEVKPGVVMPVQSPVSEPLSPKSGADVIPQFENIVDAIMLFDESDDGIMINHKFRNIVEVMEANCSSEEETRHMFNYIYTKALNDSEYLYKFLVLVTLNSFRSTTIHDVRLRVVLIQRMQSVYENATDMIQWNKPSFHNSIRILGGFYDKATMDSNTHYHVFSIPLISYLEMLLNCGQADDIELFTNQLYLNGFKIITSTPTRKTKLQEVLNNVRSQIISNSTHTDMSKAWLLLALDLANNEYRILPSELLNYYQVKLGEKAMHNLQKPLNALSIRTPPSSKFAPMSSDVNVLQVDTTTKPPPIVHQQVNHMEPPPQNHYHSSKSPNVHKEDEPYNNWDGNDGRRKPNGKPGRPILGAGARTYNKDAGRHKQKASNDGTSGWGQNRNDPREFRSSKGWEHDDRFDTDYN